MNRITPTPVFAGLSLALLSPALQAQLVPSDAWLETETTQLALDEYGFQSTQGAFSAPNRSQALRSRVASSGLEVVPRKARVDTADWRLVARTAAFGRSSSPSRTEAGTPVERNGRIELDHGVLVEWFENRPSGLEQGWTVGTAPTGHGDLVLTVELNDEFVLRVDPDQRGGVLVHRDGAVELPYRGLVAFDATGRFLSAAMEATESGFQIRVDDECAQYPVTIDPVLEGPTWAREGNQTGAQYGQSVTGGRRRQRRRLRGLRGRRAGLRRGSGGRGPGVDLPRVTERSGRSRLDHRRQPSRWTVRERDGRRGRRER